MLQINNCILKVISKKNMVMHTYKVQHCLHARLVAEVIRLQDTYLITEYLKPPRLGRIFFFLDEV